ncbi:hypothetical protein Tco_1410232 [Tanacetum coccineum]
MDSIILIGQKNTLAEYIVISGADNSSSMLDKDLMIPRKCRMEEGMILNQLTNWSTHLATIVDKWGDQGQINMLIVCYRRKSKVAKDLWEKVQLLMQGTSLTK